MDKCKCTYCKEGMTTVEECIKGKIEATKRLKESLKKLVAQEYIWRS